MSCLEPKIKHSASSRGQLSPCFLNHSLFSSLASSLIPSYQPIWFLPLRLSPKLLVLLLLPPKCPRWVDGQNLIPRHWTCPYEMIGYDFWVSLNGWIFSICDFFWVPRRERHHCIYRMVIGTFLFLLSMILLPYLQVDRIPVNRQFTKHCML